MVIEKDLQEAEKNSDWMVRDRNRTRGEAEERIDHRTEMKAGRECEKRREEEEERERGQSGELGIGVA